MKTAILVAHGARSEGIHSKPKVKIITKSYTNLTFAEAIAYMGGGKSAEYPSTSVGSFDPLSDDECKVLFGKTSKVDAGPSFIDTGKRRAGDMAGYKIFALRGQTATFDDVGLFANAYDKVILVACRG